MKRKKVALHVPKGTDDLFRRLEQRRIRCDFKVQTWAGFLKPSETRWATFKPLEGDVLLVDLILDQVFQNDSEVKQVA